MKKNTLLSTLLYILCTHGLYAMQEVNVVCINPRRMLKQEKHVVTMRQDSTILDLKQQLLSQEIMDQQNVTVYHKFSSVDQGDSIPNRADYVQLKDNQLITDLCKQIGFEKAFFVMKNLI